ncbi:MAG: phosphodiester glycosidase family protein [Chloroflexi bacterium]|nr:phosphodiester glycosidase family protein [Chloroflexota bacterium]
MKTRFLLSFCLAVWCFAPLSAALAATPGQVETPEGWETAAPGVEYQMFARSYDGNPVQIFVTRMDRSNPNVTIESSIAQGKLSGGVETVLDQAARYEEAISFWNKSWGGRNHVAAAINGYFFGEPNEPPGVPWSGQIHSAWHAKRFDFQVGDAGFVWTLDGEAFIDKCVRPIASKNMIAFGPAGAPDYDVNIENVNIIRDGEESILYTPQYDAHTRTDTNNTPPKVEISIELRRPAGLNSNSDITGVVRAIREGHGDSPLPFDYVVLAGWGAKGDTILSRVAIGDIAPGVEVQINQEASNCLGDPYAFDWTNAFAAIGGDYHFLTGGVYDEPTNPDAAVRNSRTAIAHNAQYVFFIVVDGWNEGVSEGITVANLADFIQNTLGADDAVSQDSGSSSTLVVNSQVVNNTYCNINRQNDPACWPATESDSRGVSEAELEFVQSAGIQDPTAALLTEPYVANGMMMVVVEPITRSLTFTVTQPVITLRLTEARLGPGDNYAAIGTVGASEQGEVIESLSGLNGVEARGAYWWRVDFNNATGWVREDALLGGSLTLDNHLFLPLVQK